MITRSRKSSRTRFALAQRGFGATSRSAASADAPPATEKPLTPVELPLKLFSLPGKYATALYSTAVREGSLQKVDEDMKSLDSLIKSTDSFATFLKNPLVERSEKVQLLADIGKESKFQPTTTKFLDMIAENGRLGETPKILESFERLVNAHYGEVTVVVTSAQALKPAEEKHLEESIEMLMKKESGGKGGKKKLSVVKKVDKALLGGLVVEIGDKMIDLSIKSQIADLEKYLRDSV